MPGGRHGRDDASTSGNSPPGWLAEFLQAQATIRQEEENRRRDEENKRRTEENLRREEVMQEENRRRDEENKRREELMQEDNRRREEENKRRMEENWRREELMQEENRHRDEENKRREELMQEENRRRDEENHQTLQALIQSLTAQNLQPAVSQVPVVPQPETTRGHEARPAKPQVNPPAPMPIDITLSQFSAWRDNWADYSLVTDFDILPSSQQLARFRQCLMPEMRNAVKLVLGIGEETELTVDQVLGRIHGYVRSKRNVALDRVDFEERRQQSDEAFDDFYVAIRQLAENAELCDTCLDQRLVTRIMSGIRDPETRRKLLALAPFPSLQAAVDLCRSEESSYKNEHVLSGLSNQSSMANQVSKQKHKAHGRIRSKSTSRAPGSANSGACFCCGSKRQTDKTQCPAWNADCHNFDCSERGISDSA